MIILVPVSRFCVKYEVAAGFPYSQLERLVLRAIREGMASVDDLVMCFKLHPRLLIQSLVTLIHAGWVALGNSEKQQFVLTQAGRSALDRDELPPSLAIRAKQTHVILERVTGAVMPESETSYVSSKVLRDKGLWDECIRLPQQVFDSRLDDSQVYHLLPRQQGERLHWIGPINMVTKWRHFIPVAVDLERESVSNLPRRCEAQLKPLVLDRAREEMERRGEQSDEYLTWEDLTQQIKVGRLWGTAQPSALDLARRDWSITWNRDDLLSSGEQHKEVLQHTLATASTSVLIASSDVAIDQLEFLKPSVIAALDRGVDIDLLWRHAESKDCLDWMKRLRFDQRSKPGKLYFNEDPVLSNSRLLLWDDAEGYKAIVSSHDWLMLGIPGLAARSLDLGVRVSHPAIVGFLARCVASAWSSAYSEAMSSVPDRWQRIAIDLEGLVSTDDTDSVTFEPDQATVHVILNSEHLALLHTWLASAQGRLLVASARLGHVDERLVNYVSRRPRSQEFTFRALYGQTDASPEVLTMMQQSINRAGGQFSCREGLGANIVVADLAACISSFSFLSKSPPNQPRVRDVGLVIEGVEPSNQIAQCMLDAISF